ncbi:TGS domain-containing protein [Klebsiella pneumoniae]|uniref:TGS domain-containing protein n=1 Tax=Klebsiella pneumoniae TaxID=573 RepID=UPI0020237402|nr:TGS domain-containing protein [Klebsiella pneumoniae]URI22243.1 TGS domain-containing protein [Klebsiella pneumoniae]
MKMSEAPITESEPLTFTLPDGSLKHVRKGATLQNVAESIGSSVAKNAENEGLSDHDNATRYAIKLKSMANMERVNRRKNNILSI